MTLTIIQGNHLKGFAISDNEAETQKFITEKKADGATVRLVRRYETFMGERFEVNPKLHRIRWTF